MYQGSQAGRQAGTLACDSLDIGVGDVKEARAGREILDAFYRHTPACNALNSMRIVLLLHVNTR